MHQLQMRKLKKTFANKPERVITRDIAAVNISLFTVPVTVVWVMDQPTSATYLQEKMDHNEHASMDTQAKRKQRVSNVLFHTLFVYTNSEVV